MLPPYMTSKKVNIWKDDVARLHVVWAEELASWANKWVVGAAVGSVALVIAGLGDVSRLHVVCWAEELASWALSNGWVELWGWLLRAAEVGVMV
jgi:hypothetical protein